MSDPKKGVNNSGEEIDPPENETNENKKRSESFEQATQMNVKDHFNKIDGSRKEINQIRTELIAFKTQLLDSFSDLTKEVGNTNERIVGEMRQGHQESTLELEFMSQQMSLCRVDKVDFLPNVKNSRKFSIQSSSSSSQNSLIYSEPFEIDAYEQKYTELERVGEGAHGLVKLCREKEPMTGNIYVVKIIRSDQEEIVNAVQNEYNLLQAIEHQNIIKAREMFVSKRQGLIRIIFEYEKCVSLAAFLKQRTLNEVECKKIILQLLSAIEYLHTQRIVHRDINPSNIVINEDLHLKLIDFGVAKQTEVYDDMIYSPTGTHQYQAPQVLDNQPYNSRIDIYSTGLVLTEMLLGKLPNSKLLKDMEEIKALFQSKQTISQNCINFVCQMLEENPEKRLNIKKFKDEAWLVPVIRIENLPNREDTQLSQASESPSKRYLTPKQFQNTENKENKNIRLQQSLTEQSKRFNNQFNSTSIFKIYQ